ncbi:MAG: cell division topological specificity factor MinE [Gammaproteobacteria bacterium]|nr:MAG: cell division topological specificity factor MinE [Gammaproteobacteria bacterium]
MGIFNFFRPGNETSAKVAKDRLQVLIAHERSGRNGPDYLPMLRKDILDVIKKYVSVSDDALSVQVDSQDDCDVLELNITLPEEDNEPRQQGQPSAEARRRAAERRRQSMV